MVIGPVGSGKVSKVCTVKMLKQIISADVIKWYSDAQGIKGVDFKSKLRE